MESKIDELIKKIETERDRRILFEKKQNKKSKLEYLESVKFEKSKVSEKLELLDKILIWAREFSNTSRFNKILKITYGEAIIFYSRWGHLSDYSDVDEDPGCWARVVIDKKGVLEYQSGYKWMGFRVCFYLNKENIEKIKYNFLKKLLDSLESGKVYDVIKGELKENA